MIFKTMNKPFSAPINTNVNWNKTTNIAWIKILRKNNNIYKYEQERTKKKDSSINVRTENITY